MVVISKTVNRDVALNTEPLKGVTFNRENKGHKFVISCMRGGALETVTGTVVGYFMRANNTTCRIAGEGFAGVDSDGRAWVVLPQDCYNVAGRFKLSVYVSHDGASECIYSCIGTVERSDVGEVIDSGVPLPSYDDIEDMYQEMESAVESAQQAASFVTSIVASAYSTSVMYSVGDYCTYEGAMYRCTAETDGAFDPADWEAVKVGTEFLNVNAEIDDLKSALITNPVIVESATSTGWRLNQTDGLCTKNSSYNLKKYSITPGVIYEIVSDDHFQFQSSASVPSSGTNANLIGSPYPTGTYVLIAPQNATHLIVSTPASGSTQQVSVKSGLGVTYANYNAIKRAVVREIKDPDVVQTNWVLLNSGLSVSRSGCKILKYLVNEGETIDMKTTALPYNAASYQFQSSQKVPSSGTNTYLIGNPVLSLIDGFVTVPSGASWLMMSALVDDTETGIYINKAVADLETDEKDLRERAIKYDTKATPDQNPQGWKLRSDGLSQSVNTYQLLKYKVTAGEQIYLAVPLAISGNASYQFQTDARVPTSGTNTYLVGEPKTNAENGKIQVPATATWLIISALKTDTESGIYVSTEIESIKNSTNQDALYDVLLSNSDAINKAIASRWLRSTTAIPLTFLWFSDIHRDKTSLDRIIKVKNHLKSIDMLDETICTGDLVRASSYEASGSSDFNNFWYNTDGTEDILIAVGNHEYYAQGSQPHGKIGISEIDSYYLQDIGNWNVVRESNYPFYYKDYANQGIRLIVTDPAIQTEADETTWLNGVLEDARTKGLAVVVASHYVRLNSGTEIQSATVINNNWSDNVSRSDGTKTLNYDWTGSCDIVKCVTDFITAGGIFLCYLIGHWHWDIVMHPVGHPEQLIISIAAATPDRVQTKLTSNDLARYEGTRTHDAFNIVTFDAENKIIKCVRVGSNMNMYEQPRTAFAYDVANHQFLSVI